MCLVAVAFCISGTSFKLRTEGSQGLGAMLLKARCNRTSCGMGSKFALHMSGLPQLSPGMAGGAGAGLTPQFPAAFSRGRTP